MPIKFKTRILSYLVLFYLLPYDSLSQEGLKDYTFNLKIHSGFVMNHSVNMAHLANQRPVIFELDFFKQTLGYKHWEQIQNYPKVGYSFNFIKMDPRKPLGNSYALIVYLEKNIFRNSRHQLGYRFGVGPGIINKRFNLANNYKNNLISSRFNYCLNGQINYYVHITPQINCNLGIGIIHFSNGNIKLPNLGINVPSIHIGFGFQPKPTGQFIKDSLPPVKKDLNFFITGALGLKESFPILGPTYAASTFSFYLSKSLSRKSLINLGADYMIDFSLKRYWNDNTLKIKDLSKIGIIAGHELLISKVSLLTQLGVYLYDPYKLNKSIYQRYALKYYFKHNLYSSIALKAHFGSADYAEWGIGFRL